MLQQALRYKDAGNLAEAERIIRQMAEQSSRQARGRTAPEYFDILLGDIYRLAGRFQDAEETLLKAKDGIERRLGPGHESALPALMSLGQIKISQGQMANAERYFASAKEISLQRYGANDPVTAEALNALAVLYMMVGAYDKAEPLLLDALRIYNRDPGRFQDSIADVQMNLSTIDRERKQYAAALKRLKSAFDITGSRYGDSHPNTLRILNNVALIYELTGEYDQAEPLLQRNLQGQISLYGEAHPETAKARNNLGWLYLYKADFARARPLLQSALKTYIEVRDRQLQGIRTEAKGVDEREMGRTILGLLKSNANLANASSSLLPGMAGEAFVAAQAIGRTEAARALSRTVTRLAAGSDRSAQLIREAQELTAQQQSAAGELARLQAQPPAQRNAAREAQMRQDTANIQSRLTAVGQTILREIPEYASLARPKPLTITEVQSLLRDDEALVYISSFGGANGEGTFVWILTHRDTAWNAADDGLSRLWPAIETLRCGLDPSQWYTQEGNRRCAELTGGSAREALPPFRADIAHQVYQVLFGNSEAAIAGKTLYIVSPEPISSLPLQVLVSKAPSVAVPRSGNELRDTAWLGRSHAIAVLPSVDSLKGLRAAERAARAPEPFIGFGNPVLLGNRQCPQSVMPTDDCDVLVGRGVKGPQIVATSRAPAPPSYAKMFRTNGSADVDAVRALCPLPDTAIELKCVARSLGAPASRVRTAAEASLPQLRRETLSSFRVIQFATHGLVASEAEDLGAGVGEPALVLTPPATAVAADDGLLKASEIARMKLNADWVVLSACNTAAGAEAGSEALSGLASAFFHAGARALLVSHWPVQSLVAVKLTTRAFEEINRNPKLGRAEAMRRSMAEVRDNGQDADAHPVAWAPFSVVGEAGAVSQP